MVIFKPVSANALAKHKPVGPAPMIAISILVGMILLN
jgi:hypothetical protein